MFSSIDWQIIIYNYIYSHRPGSTDVPKKKLSSDTCFLRGRLIPAAIFHIREWFFSNIFIYSNSPGSTDVRKIYRIKKYLVTLEIFRFLWDRLHQFRYFFWRSRSVPTAFVHIREWFFSNIFIFSDSPGSTDLRKVYRIKICTCKSF
jgi:hypothetical protein